MPQYDALLVVSFGGPEGPEDVLPFLENVVRGKRVPRNRLLEVAEHYQQFGGVSPLNAHNRALIEALRIELAEHGPNLPIYWGNRNWHPLLPDTLRQMADDGMTRALAFVTSAYSSYSGCRQYLDDIARARAEVGHRAPQVDKLRVSTTTRVSLSRWQRTCGRHSRRSRRAVRETVHLIYTGHSIPMAMARGCHYEQQLREASQLVSERVGPHPWQLVYQSRSGPPDQPWLEPDIGDCLQRLHADDRVGEVVVVPIGFVADHMEVVYDLDTEAKALCDGLGMHMVLRCHGGNPSTFFADDWRTHCGTHERATGTPGAWPFRPEPRRLSSGLLSIRTPHRWPPRRARAEITLRKTVIRAAGGGRLLRASTNRRGRSGKLLKGVEHLLIVAGNLDPFPDLGQFAVGIDQEGAPLDAHALTWGRNRPRPGSPADPTAAPGCRRRPTG